MSTRTKSPKMEVDNCNDQMDCDMDSDCEIQPKSKSKKMSRTEKSKVAAKSRRDKEAVEFAKLIDTLPVAKDIIQKMDKSSIVRLIIHYMKIKHFLEKEVAHLSNELKSGKRHVSLPADTSPALPSPEQQCLETRLQPKLNGTKELAVCGMDESQLMLSALNGFLILLDKKKNVMFVSDNVVDFLGLTKEKMIGLHIREFIHPDDIPELRKQFNLQTRSDCSNLMETEDMPKLDNQRMFYIRMKYCLARHGHKTQQNGYMLIQWTGKLKMRRRMSTKLESYSVDSLLCICRPMQTNSVVEIRMDGNMFMSRHDLGMTFTFCDSRIITLIGYEPCEVIGKTAYQFHNPLDAETVGKCHSNLIVKGTSVSKYYRFIGKSCDWVWMQTRATIIYNTSNEPQYVVCMNYIISEEEGQRYMVMEQEAQAVSCAKGIMEISCSGATPDRQSSVDQNDHSDCGYYSANSPYSSINPSPNGNQTDDDPGTVMPPGTSNQFPIGVLREVSETMNPEPSETSEESAFIDLINSLNKENTSGNWMNTQDVYPQVPTTSSQSMLSISDEISSQIVSPPGPTYRDETNLDESFNGSLMSVHSSSSSSLNHGTPQMMLNEDSNMSSSSIPSPSVDMSAYQKLQPNGRSVCDMSIPNSTIDYLQSAASQPVSQIPRNNSFPTMSQTSCNLQNMAVYPINSAEDSTAALPSELSDFCIQFLESSMSENQAQQILDELGKQGESLPTFDEFRNQTNENTQNKAECFDSQLTMNCGVPFTSGNQSRAATITSPQDSGLLGMPSLSQQMPPPQTPYTPSLHQVKFSISKTNNVLPQKISPHYCSPSSYSEKPNQTIQDNNLTNQGHQTFNYHQTQQKMTELEKMLRGYTSQRFIGNNGTQCGANEKGATLLQQMLTGRLSGDCYHAMEGRRKATYCLRPNQQ